MVKVNFDANTVEPQTAFDAIPAGPYLAMITESEVRDTRDGDNQYLKLEFEIVEGKHKGRKLWVNLNLWHSNKQASSIAEAEMSAICHAVNIMQPSDTSELHDTPMCLKVAYIKDGYNGEPENKIKGYYPKSHFSKQADPSAPRASRSGPTQGNDDIPF
ncbi:MAG: DUF669 domain-containing protein [FCB group bacterium]|nr:DUF669 domain-containing protein [FCB group bacterium]